MEELKPGVSAETTAIVTDELTAARYASGLVAAFATPALVGLVENASYEAVRPCLPPGQTTVGLEVNVRHLAATPVGMRVRGRSQVARIEGRKIFFNVEAWDEVEKIGEGTHIRVIVDEAKFNERFKVKRANVKRET